MKLTPEQVQEAMEWLLPLGACCAEAQADGVPCQGPAGNCLECERAETVRRLLLRMALHMPSAFRDVH